MRATPTAPARPMTGKRLKTRRPPEPGLPIRTVIRTVIRQTSTKLSATTGSERIPHAILKNHRP